MGEIGRVDGYRPIPLPGGSLTIDANAVLSDDVSGLAGVARVHGESPFPDNVSLATPDAEALVAEIDRIDAAVTITGNVP